jgi:pyruvate formate lyase activating enzyme
LSQFFVYVILIAFFSVTNPEEGYMTESGTGDPKAIVFNVQRFSTEDGPGIRTTVFLKGCPLTCLWCHNPEGISPKAQLLWFETRCIGIRDCLKACPEEALELTPQGLKIDRDRCTACGLCEEACPAAALEVVGKEWSLEALLVEVKKDESFYRTSGGGITLGGGEPMSQAGFVAPFLERCKAEGLHTALDTSGIAAWSLYEKVLPYVDLLLLDLKQMDPEAHGKMAGVKLEPILENARKLGKSGLPVWVRTPIIPGYTDTIENVRAVARFVAREMPGAERYDLLAFNNLCSAQYERLGMEFPLKEAELVRKEEMEALKDAAVEEGAPNVHWSGATRLEEE